MEFYIEKSLCNIQATHLKVPSLMKVGQEFEVSRQASQSGYLMMCNFTLHLRKHQQNWYVLEKSLSLNQIFLEKQIIFQFFPL